MSDLTKAAEKMFENRLAAIFENISIELEEDIREKIMEENAKLAKTTTKGRKQKDPNQPKRPQNAYLMFLGECRRYIKGEEYNEELLPQSAIEELDKIKKKMKKGTKVAVELTRYVSPIWNDILTDEEKQPFVDLSGEQMTEYKKEMLEYKNGGKNKNKPKNIKNKTKKKKEAENEYEEEEE